MSTFLIIDNDKIINAILADSIEVAQEITGLEAIESTDSEPWIDWTRLDGVWSAPVVPEEISTEPEELPTE
jgi:hypothetical protein